jgi:hypothetical protein
LLSIPIGELGVECGVGELTWSKIGMAVVVGRATIVVVGLGYQWMRRRR